MAASVTSTLPNDWKYVSEGGATIVFSYNGPSNPQFDGTVLRLRKTSSPSIAEQPLDQPDDPMVEFQKKCMERLIPTQHLPRLASVRVDRAWLERLVALCDVYRPNDRRNRDQIDLTRTKGVLATDLVGGNWLAVEIKPKWGFLPTATHLSEATRAIKTRTCRFCMHSRVRVDSGEKASLGYCPLDLFSEEEHRVRNAVYSLWDAWVESDGTINNLKIFSQGELVLPSNVSLISSEDNSKEEYHEDFREAFTSAILPLLMDTPVLRTLSKLQRTLDILDIEGLAKLYRTVEGSEPLFASFPTPLSKSIRSISPSKASSEPTISEWTEFLDIYLSPAGSELDHTNPAKDNLRYYLLAYLLSATFKDCSMVVRLNLLGSSLPFSGIISPEQVTVIDLDPKSMNRLRKWEKLDREIVEANLAVINSKLCVDRCTAW